MPTDICTHISCWRWGEVSMPGRLSWLLLEAPGHYRAHRTWDTRSCATFHAKQPGIVELLVPPCLPSPQKGSGERRKGSTGSGAREGSSLAAVLRPGQSWEEAVAGAT